MGCASSKLDDLPAVALCRERCTYLDEAIQQRYTLAEAHLGYLHSLRSVGICLHRFFDQNLDNSPPSPVINLPTHRKGDPQPSGSPPQKAAAIHNSRNHQHEDHHSHSNSGSHLNFHTDSDSDDSESESHLHLHSESNSPVHGYGQINYGDQEPMNSMYPGVGPMNSMYPGGGFMGMNMNYMRNSATPSVIYEQRPMSAETVRMGESSASYYPPPYDNPNPNPYYNHQGYGGGPPGYGGGGVRGFLSAPQPYGSTSYPPPPAGPSGAASMEASTSKPPPPPPSPPRTSGWDFLNPFESFESYYPPYTPSRDSREVREEEGIPDLEEVDDFQHEVVKEVDMNQKFGDSGGGGGSSGAAAAKNYSKGVVIDEQHHHHTGKAADSDTLYDDNNARQSASVDSEPVEYEVHVVDKKVVDKEEKSGDRGNVAAAFKASADSEVVREIQVQFERASESGIELAKMLEVGKFPYKRKHHSHVSSKMLNVMTPSLPIVSSLPSTSASIEADPAFLDNENVGMRSGNLSSTLQKLYLWEKKLYEEVKVEEKMRVLHERKSIRLKRLDEKGAETHKIDATRTLVRSLSTKIRIAIQVVDKISVKINTLRDEELWPQMNEFVQGLTRMWKAMYECHHTQCQAIAQAKRLDAVASGKHFSDAHLEATLQLEQELLNWTFRFSSWISSQKGYVRALNNWLLKCLLYVPEETPDGIVPFSPGRIGAPPIFVICNQWSQALERISEKEVVEALRDFATSVLQLWERDKVEMRHRMMGGKDTERKVKYLEREDQKIHKELQALDKRIVLISGAGNGLSLSGHVVFQSDTSRSSSLQVNLQHIFEAMDRFTANSSKAYEELVQRIEEDRLDRLSREDESS